MCLQLVERYAKCRCLYHKHAVDPCSAYGQRGHPVQERTVFVGYACSSHSYYKPDTYAVAGKGVLPDSGYSSGGRRF